MYTFYDVVGTQRWDGGGGGGGEVVPHIYMYEGGTP